MATKGRPAQGNNSNNPITKKVVGGDNVNTGGTRAPKVNNNKPRGIT